MPKFTKAQAKNPLKALTDLKQFLDKKVMDAGNSSDLEIKVELIGEAVDEYVEKMGSLSTIYTEHGHHPEIDTVIADLKKMWPIMKGMQERYNDQYKAEKTKKEVKKEAVVAEDEEWQEFVGGDTPHEEWEADFEHFDEHIARRNREAQEWNKKQHPETQVEPIPTGVINKAKAAIEKAHANREETQKKIKEMEENHKRNEKIDAAMDKLDDIFAILLSRTGGIGESFPVAKEAAETLYTVLYDARTVYEEQLRTGKDGDRNISTAEAGAQFKNLCADAIEIAMPVLERDLGWGEYLKNMMKSIANTVIKGVTMGHVSNFFTQNKSEGSQAFTQAGEELQQADEDDAPSP